MSLVGSCPRISSCEFQRKRPGLGHMRNPNKNTDPFLLFSSILHILRPHGSFRSMLLKTMKKIRTCVLVLVRVFSPMTHPNHHHTTVGLRLGFAPDFCPSSPTTPFPVCRWERLRQRCISFSITSPFRRARRHGDGRGTRVGQGGVADWEVTFE